MTNATKLLQESDKNSERICRAYKQHVCSFGKSGKGCPFAHPARCKTFCDYGLKKFNQNGCDQKMCKLLHPRLCIHAVKHGECFKKECKYHHLKGTKRFPPKITTSNFTNQNEQQPCNIQQNDKMTSFLLAEVGKMMEKLERRIETKFDPLLQQTQNTPTLRTPQIPHPQFYQPPPRYQHPNRV